MELEAALRRVIAEVVREELARALAELRASAREPTTSRGDDEFVDVSGAAKLLGLHHTTIREWINSGRLKSFRAGRVYRLRVADVKACLERPTPQAKTIDVEKQAQRILSRRATWEKEKAEVIRAAKEKGEKISHHEVTKRTRLSLIAKYGRWR